MSGLRDLDPSIRRYVEHPAVAADYDAFFSDSPLFAFDTEFLLERIAPGARVLDIGSGTGRHLSALAGSARRLTGVDLSEHMLREARRKLLRAGVEATLIRADMTTLPFAPGPRFDAILLMFSTLGLVFGAEKRRALLEDVRRLLAPGGRLFLHVHNEGFRRFVLGGGGISDRVRRILGAGDPGDHVVRNYRGLLDLRLHSFTLDELRTLLASAGFPETEVLPLNVRRDGPCREPDPERRANGFLVAAEPLSS